MLYEFLTGRTPFAGPESEAVLYTHVNVLTLLDKNLTPAPMPCKP